MDYSRWEIGGQPQLVREQGLFIGYELHFRHSDAEPAPYSDTGPESGVRIGRAFAEVSNFEKPLVVPAPLDAN